MRGFSSVSQLMVLQGDVGAGDTILELDTLDGIPAVPFTVVIDAGEVQEEICEVTSVNVGALTLTVTRAIEGSSAEVHLSGATVRHMATARDFSEAFAGIEQVADDLADHEAETTNVHGIASTAALVTLTGAQTLTGKVISGADNTLSAIPDAAIVGVSGSKVSGTVASATAAATVNGVRLFAQESTPTHSGEDYSAVWVR